MKKKRKIREFVWMSFSDLSTGLMISFILIFLVAFKKNKESEAVKEREIKNLKEEQYLYKNKNIIVKNLKRRLKDIEEKEEMITKKVGAVLETRQIVLEGMERLVKSMRRKQKYCKNTNWKVIKSNQSIRITFVGKKSWFKSGSFKLSNEGKKCLWKFGPLWLDSIFRLNKKHRKRIGALIIEGHTNSKGMLYHKTENAIYNYNLELSQNRSLITSKFILNATEKQYRNPSKNSFFNYWKRKILSASGRSYSNTLRKAGIEDLESSKRVEFKFKLKHNYKEYK